MFLSVCLCDYSLSVCATRLSVCVTLLTVCLCDYSLSVCHASLSLSSSISFLMSVRPSVCLLACLSVFFLSHPLYLAFCLCLSFCLCLCLSVSSCLCLSVCLSVCLSQKSCSDKLCSGSQKRDSVTKSRDFRLLFKKKKKVFCLIFPPFLFSASFLFFGRRQNICNILLAYTDCERMRILEIKLLHEIDTAN